MRSFAWKSTLLQIHGFRFQSCFFKLPTHSKNPGSALLGFLAGDSAA